MVKQIHGIVDEIQVKTDQVLEKASRGSCAVKEVEIITGGVLDSFENINNAGIQLRKLNDNRNEMTA